MGALAQLSQCNVLCYDYVGYSLNRLEGGAPSERGCCDAIDAAWAHLVQRMGVAAQDIVLYGRSIGSGPTCDLAARVPTCAGVVLESPIASGASVLLGNKGWLARPLDIFLNYKKIGRVARPVCVMHGIEDRVVPCSNGRQLHKLLQKPYQPLWVEGKGHNDMPERRCFDHVAQFVRDLERL
jgi:pimeloyl-ACP methyl ester carboxylesterase